MARHYPRQLRNVLCTILVGLPLFVTFPRAGRGGELERSPAMQSTLEAWFSCAYKAAYVDYHSSDLPPPDARLAVLKGSAKFCPAQRLAFRDAAARALQLRPQAGVTAETTLTAWDAQLELMLHEMLRGELVKSTGNQSAK